MSFFIGFAPFNFLQMKGGFIVSVIFSQYIRNKITRVGRKHKGGAALAAR
jgi:hypothetical protein